VSLDGVGAVVAAERHVEELGRLPELPERGADVRLEVVPPEDNGKRFLELLLYEVRGRS
jgi:hypothetical protein